MLLMMHVLNLTIGPNAVAICEQLDDERASQSEARTFATSKENRIERWRHCKMKREVHSMKQEWLINGKIQKLHDIR